MMEEKRRMGRREREERPCLHTLPGMMLKLSSQNIKVKTIMAYGYDFWGRVCLRGFILSRASEAGSPKNRLGSGSRRDTGR